MAAVLTPHSFEPVSAALYQTDAETIEQVQRRKLMRDPRVWCVELSRLTFYVLARVIAVPWLLVWPAVVFWVLWVSVGFDARQMAPLLQVSLGPEISWVYVTGAAFHSLTAIGCRPYESEVERRLDAFMTHWHARRGWLQRKQQQKQQ